MTFAEPPPGAPVRFGLLEAATVADTEPHGLLGIDYQPVCGAAHLTPGACVDGDSTKEPDDGADWVSAVPFAVYHLFTCRPIGVDVPARARASFELAEPIAVEEWFGDYLTNASGDDLTPAGGAVSPLAGLGYLEAFAGSVYGGQPVIHGDRGVITLLSDGGAVNAAGGRLTTVLGSRVAAGGGYATTLGDPDGSTSTDDDEGWLYVTGPVGFWRGTIINATTGIALDDEGAHNTASTLVERAYVGATSCILAAVKVSREP